MTIDLHQLLEEVTSMCRGISPQWIVIELTIARSTTPITGNHAQLRQCLANFCANARDAISAPQRVAEETRTIHLHAAVPSQQPSVVRIDVVDDGIGIEGDTRERIFEPFFTTKETGGPAGLSLAAAYGIVRDHSGWIECESQPDQGTTMSIFLPVHAALETTPRVQVTEAASLPAMADLRPYRGDESALVIADGDRFRKILDLMLERNGYKVHLGRDARDGVNLFRQEHQRIKLVVIALSRQETSGTVEDLIAELQRIDAHVRTLVVTTRPEAARRWGSASAVLLQPFNTYPILKALRSVLDK